MIRTITKTLHQQSFLFNSKLSSYSVPAALQSNLLSSNSIGKCFHNHQTMTKASLINSYSRGFASKNLKMSIKETENPDETKDPLKKFGKGPFLVNNFNPFLDDSLKFVKVTHEKSEQNSQSFFMKCMELLPESAIPELIQKIEVFKTKFIAGSGRLSATDEKTFLTSCQKLFDKRKKK